MIRTLSLAGIVTCVITSSAIAQQSLPTAVQAWVNEETVLVARIDLTRPDLATISKFMIEVPDPTGHFGQTSARFGRTLQDLAALKVREAFFLLSTESLPYLRPTLIVPTDGPDAERAAIVDSLKAQWQDEVTIASHGVIVHESGFVAQGPHKMSSNRPEFAMALASVKDSQIQIAFGLGKDVRRVLQEFLPRLPNEFGGSPLGTVTEGWNWLALGVTPSSRPSVKMIVQAKDVTSAEALQQLVAAGLKLALDSPQTKAFIGSGTGLLSLLTPSRETDQLVLSLTDANHGASRLMNEIATPLLNLMETNNRRFQTKNHLKRIGLAMHNYHDLHNAFPAAAVVSNDGKKLLSWRVLILPFLDQKELFDEFHLDESWDSEHNRKLIKRMPDVFVSSNITRDQRASGKTTFLVPIADKTLFATSEGNAIKQITDGTSNTIMVVDSNSDTAVAWTRPDDLVIDFKQPLKELSGQADGRIWALFCDGSVRAISDKLDAETMRRLFQINDGEAMGEF
ncbi:DUF1559 family PulG-like putative transporter [Schlesneria paludicola]|uniref:DUF1559 family PulG-like putative transporter n=1 Tax=Schlesneria paludicola TaxID=360056 RepID=UPI00029A94CB|nr:DUF1559 domain-containing protein [Schlesneria paludicola]